MLARLSLRIVFYSSIVGLFLNLLSTAIALFIVGLRFGFAGSINSVPSLMDTDGQFRNAMMLLSIGSIFAGFALGWLNSFVFILITRIGYYPPPQNPDKAKRYLLLIRSIIFVLMTIISLVWYIHVYRDADWASSGQNSISSLEISINILFSTLIWALGLTDVVRRVATTYLTRTVKVKPKKTKAVVTT